MTEEQYKEKRRHERIRLSLNVNWGLTSQCAKDGRITSIGPGGCFIQTDSKLLIDQIIFLRLSLGAEHILKCKVRYTLLKIGSGVAFVELTTDDETAIRVLVDNYRTTA
jgi:hypothetical protein